MGITVLIGENEKDFSEVLVELLSIREIFPRVIVWWKAISIAKFIKIRS
jgi:hypothetical protein